MSLRHGARQLLDLIETHEEEGQRLLDLAAQRVKYNPDFAIEQIHKAQVQFRKAQQIRDEKLPDMLQKAAPNLEQRVKALEDIIHSAPNVTRFKREA